MFIRHLRVQYFKCAVLAGIPEFAGSTESLFRQASLLQLLKVSRNNCKDLS